MTEGSGSFCVLFFSHSVREIPLLLGFCPLYRSGATRPPVDIFSVLPICSPGPSFRFSPLLTVSNGNAGPSFFFPFPSDLHLHSRLPFFDQPGPGHRTWKPFPACKCASRPLSSTFFFLPCSPHLSWWLLAVAPVFYVNDTRHCLAKSWFSCSLATAVVPPFFCVCSPSSLSFFLILVLEMSFLLPPNPQSWQMQSQVVTKGFAPPFSPPFCPSPFSFPPFS